MTRLLRDTLALEGAQVEVSEGGRRGMRVRVTLPASAAAMVAAVERELAGYLFESEVGKG